MNYGNTYDLDLSKWPLAKAIWLKFSRDCPQFDVSGSEQAFSKVVRMHKDELHAGGVVVRLQNGTWLGHPTRFREAIMAKLSGRSVPPLKHKPAALRHAGKAHSAVPAQHRERAAA